MIKNAQILYVQWFLDFINADLGTLTPGERMKLTTDAITIIDGLGSLLFYGQKELKNLLPSQRWYGNKSIEDVLAEWREGEQLKECHVHLKEFFKNMMQKVKDVRDQVNEGRKRIPNLDNFFCFGKPSIENFNMRIETPILEWEDMKREGDDVTAHISEESLLKAPILVSYKAPKNEDTLLFYFCQTLMGLPLGALRICADKKCDNWYAVSNKRERKFCSQKCGMRNANRERRKRIKNEDPENYERELNKGKKRAKKSYEKRLREKLGEKVIIGK
jgi:hypothetical protein